MPSVTYHVVVPFLRDDDGNEGKEAPSSEAARRSAAAIAATPPHVGPLAFKRTSDPDLGDFQDGKVIAEFGEADRGLLQG